jgi:hypothetical protein
MKQPKTAKKLGLQIMFPSAKMQFMDKIKYKPYCRKSWRAACVPYVLSQVKITNT